MRVHCTGIVVASLSITLTAIAFLTPAVARQRPNAPNAKGVSRTWAKLDNTNLIKELKAGGYVCQGRRNTRAADSTRHTGYRRLERGNCHGCRGPLVRLFGAGVDLQGCRRPPSAGTTSEPAPPAASALSSSRSTDPPTDRPSCCKSPVRCGYPAAAAPDPQSHPLHTHFVPLACSNPPSPNLPGPKPTNQLPARTPPPKTSPSPAGYPLGAGALWA